MKKAYLSLIVAIAGIVLFAGARRSADTTTGFTTGTPAIQSITSLAFGPNGVLFIGDSKSASVFAIDTKDAKNIDKSAAVEIPNIDQKIAAALGTQKENIRIMDMAVNPLSKKVYLAVQTSNGSPVLLKIEGDKIQPV